MALKLAGEEIGIQEKIETITYNPGLQDTGDLEAGTKTITATSKPGTADYSKALTIASPGDARGIIRRIAARLSVTRDSGTSSNLYCTVAVDSADGSANRLFNAVDVQAAALQVANLTAGTVFDLLTDGSAHTFYFFFWVNAGDSVISAVRLWEGVGNTTTTWHPVFTFEVAGLVGTIVKGRRAGSGSGTHRVYNGITPSGSVRVEKGQISGAAINYGDVSLEGIYTTLVSGLTLVTHTAVDTDIMVIEESLIVIRSEQ